MLAAWALRLKKKSNEAETLSFDDFVKLGLGRLRLSPSAFWPMLLQDFILAVKGFNELEQQREREHWERARWLGCVTLQPYGKKGKSLQPTDLIKFPWDKKRKRKAHSGNYALAQLLKKHGKIS